MKIKVEMAWLGGLLIEGEADDVCDPLYYLIDVDTGRRLDEQELNTYEEVEEFIAATYPHANRWNPPPSPNGTARLEGILQLVDRAARVDPCPTRRFLIGCIYRAGCPEAMRPLVDAAIRKLAPKA